MVPVDFARSPWPPLATSVTFVAMKPGHESKTAVMVCAARAAAHARTDVAIFADPAALTLLPEEARLRVEQFRSGAPPKGLRERVAYGMIVLL